MLSSIAAFGFVLALLGAALKVLQRFAPGAARSGGKGLRMEVVQRLALGPKQGIAVVRVGERLLAVSMGDGGVRLLQELGEAEAAAAVTEPARPAVVPGIEALRSPRAFGALVRQAIRSAAVALFTVGLLGAAGAGTAEAQVRGGIAPQATAEPAARATAEQVDRMIPELAPQMDVRVGQGAGGLRLSGTVGVVVMMGLMTLLPTLLLMMTGFTRILIVLHFLRQALGTQSAPPGQLMAALALLLTGFVMAPTLAKVNETALQPWMNGTIEQAEMLSTGVRPFREFMFAQVRESDVTTFLQMSSHPQVASVDEVPLVVLMTAFVTSELRTAFQIGFALFLPFIVIDVVVASVLMSMGMMMLPPAMISLPFKILLFVLVDGWALIAQGLVTSFR